ncbi:MAG: hypothetical protein ABF991_12610 [Liquorilactobacillus hordei]|uniref:hypothetical protein n=1 Tax=Liquorilactobacillus hordei TaxID=468911 RepID=UPI0039EA15CF
MIYADKISFNQNDKHTLKTIVQIHLITEEPEKWKLEDEVINGWFKKETIYRWLKNKGDSGFKIEVSTKPKTPLLEPVKDGTTLYVRSQKDETKDDNLLLLKAYYEQ